MQVPEERVDIGQDQVGIPLDDCALAEPLDRAAEIAGTQCRDTQLSGGNVMVTCQQASECATLAGTP